MMKRMTQFIVDRKEELNVVFVTSNGDMTNNKDVEAEWSRARAAYDLLYPAAGIPYSPCQGNHDAIPSLNKWFPVTDFETRPYWGGHFTGIENAYYLFSADGMDFVLLVQQHVKDSAAISWANSIYAQYPDRRAIHVNHYLAPNVWPETEIIKKHDNIFMAISGHDCRKNGEDYWTTKSPSGNTQHLTLSDYQCRPNLGTYVRYYTFKPNEGKVCAFTYNVMEQAYETDESSQFCFDYEMENFGDGLPHKLEVSAKEGGVVSIYPPAVGGVYAFNSKVVLTAQPMEGYQFDRWTGDIIGGHNPAVVKADADKTITAIFKDCSVDRCIERITYPLSSYGEERLDNGSVSITDELLDLPGTPEGEEQTVGLNFSGITLPPGVELVSAYIQFVSSPIVMMNTQVPSMDIRTEAVDNSSPFVGQDNNVTNRPVSRVSVNWRPARWKREYRKGTSQQTAYLTSLIQDIVDRPNWASGNNISFIIKRADDEVGGTKYRLAMNYPELVIDYTKCSK
jgi:hypothetical protein